MIIARDLKLRLTIEDPKEFAVKIKRQRFFNNTILAIFILGKIVVVGIQAMRYFVVEDRKDIKFALEFSEKFI